MKKIRKILKLMGIAITVLLLVLAIVATFFLNLSPQFGGTPTDTQLQAYEQSANYKDGKFINTIPTSLDLGFTKTVRVIYDFAFSNVPGRQPGTPLPVEKIDSLDLVKKPQGLERVTWFGHSACLLEMDNKKIFFDPMLGQTAAPHPLLGPKRYNEELPIAIEKLPYIDAVVISHDHYDHLDLGSIEKLKDKVGHFYVPLGVGAHLVEWGVKPEYITELDWWKEAEADGLTFTCTPARHFSGRGLFNNFTTLWSSWVVRSANSRVYFSGDSGYGPHFEEIGKAYGPFDLAMLECGQYNELWMDIHMMPEQTVQAAIDVRSKLTMPIHWGAFTLALHSWTDPVQRVTAKARQLNIPITTPRIGEPILLHQQHQYPNSDWWSN